MISERQRELFMREVAWRLPRRLVLWCYLRVVACATTGEYGTTVPDTLDVMTALRRWQGE